MLLVDRGAHTKEARIKYVQVSWLSTSGKQFKCTKSVGWGWERKAGEIRRVPNQWTSVSQGLINLRKMGCIKSKLAR